MPYNPSYETAALLARARQYAASVPYQVTARWVFYRLLQDGSLTQKSDYKKLLTFLSKARKQFYMGWRPDTLADDTRNANVGGSGFDTEEQWIEALAEQAHCSLDRWQHQEVYVEVWFEASAMQAQFQHHADSNITLLAFHGDISIPEKWKAAGRLYRRYNELRVPVKVLYYGDLDDKGVQIPMSARNDVRQMVADHYSLAGRFEEFQEFSADFEFIRVGLNSEHISQYSVPTNPERPGTYQWEGLEDDAAQELISVANGYIDQNKVDEVEALEQEATDRVRAYLQAYIESQDLS